jgi:hypothetical protein
MLKQILVTTAIVAIAAVSAESASAKTRQILVDPVAGNDLLLLNKKGKKPTGAAPVNNFIVAPGGGTPTPPPKGVGGKTPQLLVVQGSGLGTPGGSNPGKVKPLLLTTSGGGIATPGGDNGVGNPGKVQPLLLTTSGGGIATPNGGGNGGGGNAGGGAPTKVASADPGPVDGGKAAPVIANPSDIATPAGTDNANAAAGGVTAPPQPIATPQVADNGGAPVSPTPPDASKPAPATGGAMSLYSTLIAHGYGVEVLNADAPGDLIFYVSTPGNANEADLLLIDASTGKVLEWKHVAGYGYAYEQTPAYAPAYAPRYASRDNCNQYNGY